MFLIQFQLHNWTLTYLIVQVRVNSVMGKKKNKTTDLWNLLGNQSKELKTFPAQVDSTEMQQTAVNSLLLQAMIPKLPSVDAPSSNHAEMQIPSHSFQRF